MFEKTLESLEQERLEIETALNDAKKNLHSVNKVISLIAGKATDQKSRAKGRIFSPEHRGKIKQKQLERWAKIKAQKTQGEGITTHIPQNTNVPQLSLSN